MNLSSVDSDEYWTLSVYQIDGEALEYSQIDLLELLNTYNSNLYLKQILSLFEQDSNSYVVVLVGEQAEEDSNDFYLCLNLETLFFDNELTEAPKANTSFEYYIWLTLKSGFDYLGSFINLLDNNILDETSQLHTLYPAAYDILTTDSSYVLERQYVYFLDNSLENQISTLSLLYPAGRSLFENFTISATSSVDGQEHVVNSAEEFLQYYKKEDSDGDETN